MSGDRQILVRVPLGDVPRAQGALVTLAVEPHSICWLGKPGETARRAVGDVVRAWVDRDSVCIQVVLYPHVEDLEGASLEGLYVEGLSR